MATATERFSDRKRTEVIDGNWVAGRGWDVVGFINDDDAIAATGVTVGSPHPLVPSLKCTSINVANNKFTLCQVVAMYSISSLKSNPVDPVSRAPKIRWRWGKVAQPIDTDLSGNAIVNSAGDAFKSNSTRNISVRYLTITRYETYYDQEIADMFTDTVNSGSISFEGNSFDAGQVYMLSYAPTGDYQEGCDYVEVAYNFEIRTPKTPKLTDKQKRHPFQLRLLDQGMRCKYADPMAGLSLGQLFLANGSEITRDVLLNGAGTPMDGSIKVSHGGLNPIPQNPPGGVLVDSTGKAVFLVYMNYAETDFSQIGVSD